MQEKSRKIFENSSEGTIGRRIKELLSELDVSVTDLEEMGGIGNATLKSWKDKPLGFSSNTLSAFKLKLRIREEWWKTGEGEKFITPVQEAGNNKENRGEVYRNIVEGNTEYLLIPRSVFADKYRLVAVEKIDQEKEELREKNKQIRDLNDIIKGMVLGTNGTVKRTDASKGKSETV
jgi:hypothetical protein